MRAALVTLCVMIADVARLQAQRVFPERDTVLTVAFSPDGKTLAAGGYENLVRLWDIATGQERLVLRGHISTVCCIAYAPDGKTLASCGHGNDARVWDAATGKVVLRIPGHKDG